MDEQVRSADLLARTAHSNAETIEPLQAKPEETLRNLGKDGTRALPWLLPAPASTTNNAIGVIVVTAFALVLLSSAYGVGNGVATKLESYATCAMQGKTMLTAFITVVAFLAGLLSPSSVKK